MSSNSLPPPSTLSSPPKTLPNSSALTSSNLKEGSLPSLKMKLILFPYSDPQKPTTRTQTFNPIEREMDDHFLIKLGRPVRGKEKQAVGVPVSASVSSSSELEIPPPNSNSNSISSSFLLPGNLNHSSNPSPLDTTKNNDISVPVSPFQPSLDSPLSSPPTLSPPWNDRGSKENISILNLKPETVIKSTSTGQVKASPNGKMVEEVWFKSKVVSRNHAEIWVKEGQVSLSQNIGEFLSYVYP